MKTLFRHFLCALLLGAAAASAWASGAPQTPESPVLLRFAVLGDAEPKPDAHFPNMAGAVAQINRMAAQGRMDFVVGVGDIAHKGTKIQYDNATAVLQQLSRPFYPIMGNEEHGSTVARFLAYAERWNRGRIRFPEASYVLEFEPLVLVFASPDHGRDFADSGIAWLQQQLQRHAAKPVVLVVHGAQKGVYAESPDKGVGHPGFAPLLASPNLVAVISGDLHMDMDRVTHSKQLGHVHYLHSPGLERTKVPDESQHVPMFRVFSLTREHEMVVDTYRVGSELPLDRHRYRFPLPSRR
jgi:3',5'-cyclic-AMP phosphodiesterase